MSAPLISWESCFFPEEICNELNRRKENRGLNYINANRGGWDETGEWKKYRGPMSPWVRLCSNGRGRVKDDNNNPLLPNKIKEGFVFSGGKGFSDGYGFNSSEKNPSIIGYVPNAQNEPHFIENDIKNSNYPIHVPPPEIEKINVTIQKELFRRVTIDWVCFSKKQLEYMTPYFLIPGITCILEWGWNHYDPTSLLDLTNKSILKELFNNAYPLYTKHILKSKGNYDVLIGIITNFEWSIDGNKIKCMTEITSKDRIYSGLLVDSNAMSSNSKDTLHKEEVINPFSSLTTFVNEKLVHFKSVVANEDPSSISELSEFVGYVKEKHTANWKEYVYGIFCDRNIKGSNNPFRHGANKTDDFDYKNGNADDLWINFGLLIEVINFHSAPLKGLEGKEMFRVDIDDVVIGAHPNMISSKGDVCLIPNKSAPKYFYGKYGPVQTSDNYTSDGFEELKVSTNLTIPTMTADYAIKNKKLSDYRIQTVCGQQNGIYRDNLDEIINYTRYEAISAKGSISFEFPFSSDKASVSGSKPYPVKYSGFLKNIYVNVKYLTDILANSDDLKVYPRLIEKILVDISNACGNFWDLRLVQGDGDIKLKNSDIAAMKIVDYKFMSTANLGTAYTFDYFDADSLLLGLSFKPTLTNAQAIRSIYAKTNNPDRENTLTNGSNELLDYHFEDRLFYEDQAKNAPVQSVKKDSDGYKSKMRDLQQLVPCEGSYQITNKQDGKVIIRRLALPEDGVVSLLLDDGDVDLNPKYTGIMPSIQATFTIQGIGGLRTFMMFLVRNLPAPYSEFNIIFRIMNVEETIESGQWTTVITAGIIPLREHIKTRLGIMTK